MELRRDAVRREWRGSNGLACAHTQTLSGAALQTLNNNNVPIFVFTPIWFVRSFIRLLVGSMCSFPFLIRVLMCQLRREKMHCIPICSVRLMMMLLLIFFLGYFHYYQLPLPLPPPPSSLCACCCTLCFRCYYCGWRVCVSHSLCAHFFAFIRSFIRWFGRSLLLFDFYCLGWRLYASFAHTYINFDSYNLFIYLSFQI